MLKAAGAGAFLMLLAFDNKNNGFISIKNLLTRQGRCYTFELLNGETLAKISFEELCAGGLGRGDESFRQQLSRARLNRESCCCCSDQPNSG